MQVTYYVNGCLEFLCNWQLDDLAFLGMALVHLYKLLYIKLGETKNKQSGIKPLTSLTYIKIIKYLCQSELTNLVQFVSTAKPILSEIDNITHPKFSVTRYKKW